MAANSDLFDQAFRPSTINELFGTPFAEIQDAKERAAHALPVLRDLTKRWMAGETLRELQLSLGTKEDKLKTCVDARRFALRVIPELAYLFGLPAFLIQRRLDEGLELPAALSKLGSCVRHGYRSVEHAALAYHTRGDKLARRQVLREFKRIRPYLKNAADDVEMWDETIKRVELAVMGELIDREN
jgi:hypothetical protein